MNARPCSRLSRPAWSQPQGLHLIEVGRKAEVSALIADLNRIAEGGAAFRIVAGRFGCGKSFFLRLVLQPRFSKKPCGRTSRFHHGTPALLDWMGMDAHCIANSSATFPSKLNPTASLPAILAVWISRIQHEVMSAGGDTAAVDERMALDSRDLQGSGRRLRVFSSPSPLLRRICPERRKHPGLRATMAGRGNTLARTQAKADLGVRRIIDDVNVYDSLKLLAAFVRKAGFGGLLVSLDELVIISHRLPSTRARQANYEAVLTIVNDLLQGTTAGLGFIMAGTDECLEDKRRGLFSYEALRTRLADSALTQNTTGPRGTGYPSERAYTSLSFCKYRISTRERNSRKSARTGRWHRRDVT